MRIIRPTLAAALAALAPVIVGAQTLRLPAGVPDSLREGQSVIIRPIVLDVIGRPASVARVQAFSLDTTVVSVSYVTGGQRYTARRAGVAPIIWQWDRTDGLRVTIADTMRVYTPAPTPPPVVEPPVTPPPPTGRLPLASISISPETTATVGVGQSRSYSTWARVRVGGALRLATVPEIDAHTLTWRLTGDTSAASVSEDGRWASVTGRRDGVVYLTVCSTGEGAVCSGSRAIRIGNAPLPPADSTPPTPPVVEPPPPVITPPTTPPVTPPAAPDPDARTWLQLARDTVRVGEHTTITLTSRAPASGWQWSLAEGSPGWVTLMQPDTPLPSVAVASFECAEGVVICDLDASRTARLRASRPGVQRVGVVVTDPDGRRRQVHALLVVVP